MSYDAWKLATPPEYDELGPEFECEACEDTRECQACDGTGEAAFAIDDAPCPACDGTGQCSECSEEGGCLMSRSRPSQERQ